jgi:prevent-host-death family protein
MNTKTTISISEARKNIFKIAEQVQKPGVYFTFTEKGKPKGVIMSAEEFESWTETMEVMQQFPNLDKDIAEADRAIKTGDFSGYIALEELEKKWGFNKRGKLKTKNGISSTRRK